MIGRLRESQAAHVAAVIGVAVVLRALLFTTVGMWGDFGFYAYNADLVLEGQRPFIDFLGRSPLFIYSFAAVHAVTGEMVVTLRAFIVVGWLLTAAPVYLLAREIDGHWTGIAALAIFLLTPFSLVYGFWANTQALAALLSTWGVYALVRRDDVTGHAIFGLFLGLAFLSRRSVITFAAGLVVFSGYLVYKSDNRASTVLQKRAPRLVIAGVAFFLPLVAGYVLLAGGDISVATQLFHTHFTNLFLSFGRGGWPELGVTVPPVTQELESGRIPVFNDLCQRCGEWTARTFAKTLVLTTPIAGLGIAYMRDWTERYFDRRNAEYLAGIIGVLALYAVVMSLWAGFYLRVGVIVALVLFTVAIYRVEALDTERLYNRDMILLLCLLGGLAAGYLYRNRVLHAYYFMDFMPLVAIVAGVLAVGLCERFDPSLRAVVAVALTIAVVSSGAAAFPLVNVVTGNDAGWFTVNSTQAYGDDLDDRTQPGDVVFAANPTYVADSHARLPDDNARLHYEAVTFKGKSWGPHIGLFKRLTAGFHSGAYRYAVMDTTAVKMLRWNASAADEFETHYCRVPVDGLYRQTHAVLTRWQPADEACPSDRQIPITKNTLKRLKNGNAPSG